MDENRSVADDADAWLSDVLSQPLDRLLDQQIQRQRGTSGYRRLFLAAIEAFAEHGFHAASTRDIAARASMSPAAMYVHFQSKEEMLHRIAIATLDLSNAVAAHAVASSADPARQLDAVVRALTAWHAYHGPSVRVVLYQAGALTPEHLKEVFERQRTVTRMVRDIMTEGVRRGQFDIPDIGAATLAALSLCADTARWFEHGRNTTPTQLADRYAALALRMVAR